MKTIEINSDNFIKLVNQIDKYKETIDKLKVELEKCKKINEFLNNEIKTYNNKFVKKEEDN